MGDDDFDIYGEDDGYNEAVTFEVRKEHFSVAISG